MIINELVTKLTYRLSNSKDMQLFMRSVQAAHKRVRGLEKQLNNKMKATGFMRVVAAARRINKKLVKMAIHYRSTVRSAEHLRRVQDKATDSAGRMASAYAKIGGYVRMAVAAIGGFNLAKAMDTSASINGSLAISADAGNAKAVRDKLYNNAIKSGTSLESNVDLFSSVARNKESLGMSDADAVNLSDLVGKAVALTGGKDAGTDSAVITQFGQALSSGVLRGDELNSILEGSGGLAMAIADGFGISVDQLREMGRQGKLTSKQLAKGLLKQADAINAKFELLPKKFSQGMANLQTIFIQMIGGPLNEITNWGEKFYDLTVYIKDNFDEVATKVGAAGLAGALMYAVKNANKLKKALLPMMKMAAVFYALYLIGEDILVWLQGGKSLIGEWFGSFEKVKESLEWLINPIQDFIKGLDEAGFSVEEIIAGVSLLASGLFFLMNPIALIIAGIVSWIYVISQVRKNWREWVESMGLDADIVGAFFDTVRKLAEACAAMIVAAFNIVWGVLTGDAELIKEAYNVIKEIICEIFEIAFSVIKSLWQALVDWFKQTTLGKWFADLGKTIGDAFSAAAKFAENAWKSVIKWIEDKIKAVSNGIKKVTDFFEPSEETKEQFKNAAKIMGGGRDDWDGSFENAFKTTPVGATQSKQTINNNNQRSHQTINISTTDAGVAQKVASATMGMFSSTERNSPSVEAV